MSRWRETKVVTLPWWCRCCHVWRIDARWRTVHLNVREQAQFISTRSARWSSPGRMIVDVGTPAL